MGNEENVMNDAVAHAADREGKYLTFSLAGEEYGIGILKIREIIGMLPITSVPETPHFVKGVINLRGKVIPVVDLRLRFGMPRSTTPSAPASSWWRWEARRDAAHRDRGGCGLRGAEHQGRGHRGHARLSGPSSTPTTSWAWPRWAKGSSSCWTSTGC